MAITYRLPKGPLVLASASQTRQMMLKQAGLDFISRPANVDEVGIRKAAEASSMPAEEIAILLADMNMKRVLFEILFLRFEEQIYITKFEEDFFLVARHTLADIPVVVALM